MILRRARRCEGQAAVCYAESVALVRKAVRDTVLIPVDEMSESLTELKLYPFRHTFYTYGATVEGQPRPSASYPFSWGYVSVSQSVS